MGVHLRRTDENVREIDALGTLLGGAVGVDAVLADLNRKASRTFLLGRGPARAGRSTGASPGTARTAATSAGGRRACPRRPTPPTPRTSAASTCSPSAGTPRTRAASGSPSWTWPACGTATCCSSCRSSTSTGCSCCDRCACTPAAWSGTARTCTWPPRPAAWSPAASTTSCACRTCAAPAPTGSGSAASRWRRTATATCCPCGSPTGRTPTTGNDPLRYSFLSLDRSTEPPAIVAGEYGRTGQSTRLARYHLEPDTLMLQTGDDGLARPIGLDDGGIARMQGASIVDGRYHVTVSHGPWKPGSVYVGTPGRDGRAPARDPDGSRGHRLLALDRPVLVGQRAPAPALGVLDEALVLRLRLREISPAGR